MRVVRLGQGVDRTGELAPEALERVRVDAARTTQRRAASSASRRPGSSRPAPPATPATATTSSPWCGAGWASTPEVVTGEEEAALSFDGATRDLDPADGPFLVIDIGGGSTEFVLGTTGTGVEAALSVDVGCVRLTERHLRDRPADGRAGRGGPRRRRGGPGAGAGGRPRRAGPHRRRAGRHGHHRRRAGARACPRTTPERIHGARAERAAGARGGRAAARDDHAPSAPRCPSCTPAGSTSSAPARWCCRRHSTELGLRRGPGQRGRHPGRHRLERAGTRSRSGMSKSDWVSAVRRQDKPWGHEELFALVDGKFCGKAIHVTDGARAVAAVPRGEGGGHQRAVRPAHLRGRPTARTRWRPSSCCPASRCTCARASGTASRPSVDTVMLEASTTQLHDVVRLEDRYGRQGTSAP